MSFKIIIVVMLILMIGVLGSALLFMFKDRGKTNRTVNALTWRVGIWAVLLAFIVAGLKFGWIEPSNSLAKRADPDVVEQQKKKAQ